MSSDDASFSCLSSLSRNVCTVGQHDSGVDCPMDRGAGLSPYWHIRVCCYWVYHGVADVPLIVDVLRYSLSLYCQWSAHYPIETPSINRRLGSLFSRFAFLMPSPRPYPSLSSLAWQVNKARWCGPTTQWQYHRMMIADISCSSVCKHKWKSKTRIGEQRIQKKFTCFSLSVLSISINHKS